MGGNRKKKAKVRTKEEEKRRREFCPTGRREIKRKSKRGKMGSNRVNTCWEIADRLAVRDYCHVKRTVKMKETGPAELMGSQLGSPGEDESSERRKYSCRPQRGAVYHLESAFVSFYNGKGIYLLSSVP